MTSLGGDGNDSDASLSTDPGIDECPHDDEPCVPDLSTSVEEKQTHGRKTQPKKRRKGKDAHESDTDDSEERNVTKGWDTSLDSEAIMRMSRLAEREAGLTC